jgi:hypothetical protein
MPHHPLNLLVVSAAVALGCSGRDPVANELRPEFATACTRLPTVNSVPASVTKAPNSAASALFSVHNNCASGTSGFWDFSASRTGQVISAGPPSPQFATIAGGANGQISVPYNTGSAGTGSVKLSATSDAPFGTASGTQAVTVSGGGGNGVPFGPEDLFDSSGKLRDSSFNLTLDFTDPASIVAQINTARARKVRFVPAMTGGGHSRYLTDPARPTYVCPNNGASGCRFDFTKWKNVQNSFNTAAIKSAIQAAVADSTMPFSSLIDEPNHSSWGGVLTHALVDSMSVYSKGIFPTLKTGVPVTWTWEKTKRYQSLDVIVSQYSFSADPSVQRYRDSAVVSAKRQNVGLMFSLNLLDGGGSTFGTAQMSAAQIQNFGNVLVLEPFACGLLMWTWNSAYMASEANKTSFKNVAATAAGRPAKACGK